MKKIFPFGLVVLLALDFIAAGQLTFEDVALQAGLSQLTIYGERNVNRYLLETTGCGAAFVDYDNDGWLDVFLVNGYRFSGFAGEDEPLSHLYRNRGDGTFVDVTEPAGIGRSGWGQAVCAGDYDNDGFEDLFVTYWGQHVLYRNRRDGTFADATQEAGLTQPERRWNSGCAFLDFDRDGDLDLFVANYIDFDPDNTPTPDSGLCLYKGVAVACGPPGLPGGQNILYRNEGNGKFSDRSQESGVSAAQGTYALGVLTADFDHDGWTDIYVANDSSPSAFYQNNRDGTLTDIGVVAGCAYSQDGKPQAGMGVTAGDYDRDGDFDIFKTNFAEDSSNLYRNMGRNFFEEAAFGAGIGLNTRYLGWGCGFADFDKDGWLDIFQVNGHVYPEVDQLNSLSRYQQPKIVYRNLGNQKFEDVSRQVGQAVQVPRAGRGAAFGDYDNDGDVDVLVNNVNDRPNLYRTNSPDDHHWISIRPLGSKSNRSGIGTRVYCKAGELELFDEVRSGGSYYSQNQLRLQFGLGAVKLVDRLEVHWPSGAVEAYENVPADQFLYVVEGEGLKKER